MQRSITSYIESCEMCQWRKTHALKPTCVIQPSEISDMNCEVVSKGFKFGLTPSPHGYDAICVCVDKLSKIAHFMPTMTHATTEETKKVIS